jgi:DNA-binding NtrC family response regulator
MSDRLSIMILDDEPIVGKRLKLALKRSPYDVETFEDPRVALERLAERTFDIVITDVVMGDIDGIQVLERVQSTSPRTKVIIMTAYAMMHMARKAMDRGAFDFIAKPFEPAELRELIQHAAEALAEENGKPEDPPES